jgi:E3 ubiquitin-protein ligase MARCH6
LPPFSESQVDELAMELLLLLVILPAVQDQNHTREWLKNAIRAWCSVAAWILDLRSYLFGDTPQDTVEAEEAAEEDGNEEHLEDEQEDDELAQDHEQEEEEDEEEEQPVNNNQQQHNNPDHDGLGAAHQALLQREAPIGFQPFRKPLMFPFMVYALSTHQAEGLVNPKVLAKFFDY